MNRLHSNPDTTLLQQSLAWPSTDYATSVFQGHQLQPGSQRASSRGKMESDWITGVLIALLILLAWARGTYGKRVKHIFLAPFSNRFLSQLTREGNLFKERVTVALGIVYLFTVPLFILQIETILLHGSTQSMDQLKLFLLSMLFIVGYWMVKVALIRYLGFIFNTKATTREYLLNILIFNLITGISLLPFLIITSYTHSEWVLFVAVVLVTLLFIYRLVKGFFIGLSLTKFSYLFLFVYLCALEILPLLVILKLLLKYLNSLSL